MTEMSVLHIHPAQATCASALEEVRAEPGDLPVSLLQPQPQGRKVQPWTQAWLTTFFPSRSDQHESSCRLNSVQEELDDADGDLVDSDHFEDANNAPLSPVHVLKDRPTLVKCASKPLVAAETVPRSLLKRRPNKANVTGAMGMTKSDFSSRGIGAGDHLLARGDPDDSDSSQDSDDDELGELVPFNPLGRSSSCASNFAASGGCGTPAPTTSVSAGDLRHKSPDMKPSCRSPRTKHRRRPQQTQTTVLDPNSPVNSESAPPADEDGTSRDDAESEPPTAVLVDLNDTEPTEMITVRTVRCALLRLKDSITNGNIPLDVDDSRTYSRPDSPSSSTAADPTTKSAAGLAYWTWLRRKQEEEDRKHKLRKQQEKQQMEEERRKEEESERTREREAANFTEWLQKKNAAWEKTRRAAEQQRAKEENRNNNATKMLEAQRSSESIAKWKENKAKERKDRLAALETEAKRKEDEKQRRKEEAERKFKEWRALHRGPPSFPQFVNPEPWVDVLPPPSEEPPAPRQKRHVRRRSIQSQQRAADRLSRPLQRFTARRSLKDLKDGENVTTPACHTANARDARPKSCTRSTFSGPAWSFARPKTTGSGLSRHAPESLSGRSRCPQKGDPNHGSVTAYLQLAGAARAAGT